MFAASAAAAPDVRLDGAYKFNEGGWTYVHLQGTPEQVGFQHGYLLAREIEDNVHVYQVEAPQHAKREWSFFRDARKNVLWPHLDAEYQQELNGIAEGLKAQGSKLDLWDVVALNGYIELTRLLCAVAECEGRPAESAAGHGAGQMQRFYCHRIGNERRQNRHRAQQLVQLRGRRALDDGL